MKTKNVNKWLWAWYFLLLPILILSIVLLWWNAIIGEKLLALMLVGVILAVVWNQRQIDKKFYSQDVINDG